MQVPPTSKSAYVSGLDALNLPYTGTERSGGDWHEHATWWTPAYLDGEDRPFKIILWGPQGEIDIAPTAPQLRDARAALATIEHPAAQQPSAVYAATVPQAVLDLAWEALEAGAEPPARRDVIAWLSDEDEIRVRQMAREVEETLADPTLRARWQTWARNALEGDDPFYEDIEGDVRATTAPASVRMTLQVASGTR